MFMQLRPLTMSFLKNMCFQNTEQENSRYRSSFIWTSSGTDGSQNYLERWSLALHCTDCISCRSWLSKKSSVRKLCALIQDFIWLQRLLSAIANSLNPDQDCWPSAMDLHCVWKNYLKKKKWLWKKSRKVQKNEKEYKKKLEKLPSMDFQPIKRHLHFAADDNFNFFPLFQVWYSWNIIPNFFWKIKKDVAKFVVCYSRD